MCHYVCVQYSHSAWFLDGRTSILVAANIWLLWYVVCKSAYMHTYILNSQDTEDSELRMWPMFILKVSWN